MTVSISGLKLHVLVYCFPVLHGIAVVRVGVTVEIRVVWCVSHYMYSYWYFCRR